MHAYGWLLAAPVAAFRVALGLLLLRSGWGKARDFSTFAEVVDAYRLMPGRIAGVASRSIVALEIVLGGLLLCGLKAGPAGAGAAALFALFTAAMSVNLWRGRTEISCGCMPAERRGEGLSWAGAASTACLILPCVLAAQGWIVADPITKVQAAIAGLLLFSLHDAAIRLIRAPSASLRAPS